MEQVKKMTTLTLEELKSAEKMSVEQLGQLFQQDTMEDIQLQNKAISESDANKKFMAASRGLGHAINELLLEHESLQKRWPEILATLDAKGLMRKLAAGEGFIGRWAKKRINAKIDKTILEALPDLLLEQLRVTQKADKRVDVQKTAILQAQKAAEQSYLHLSEEIIRLRKLAREKKEAFDKARSEIKETDAKLKDKDKLSEEEFAELTKKRAELITTDNDKELDLQTTTQDLRATEEGFNMTELQIGQLTTTHKTANAISTMLKAFLRVTEPIMKRSIVILNAQKAGIEASELLYALSETMNYTLKICSYGMTVMTQQAIMLGNKDFLEKHTIEEVKTIQKANDSLWDHFTETQYAKVMEKMQPLLSFTERAGSTEKQTV